MPNVTHQDDQVQDSVKARAKIKLERDLGPDIMAALADPKTVEIMLNSDGKLWQERLGEKMRPIGTLSASRSESIIKTIAGFHGKEITKGRPLIECELPLDGSRFAGQFPPIVPAPTFAIRKKAVAIFTLDQYVAQDIMTPAQKAALVADVARQGLVEWDPHLSNIWIRVTDKGLALATMVGICRINIIHPVIDGIPEHLRCMVLIDLPVFLHGESHAPEPEDGEFRRCF